MNIVLLLNISVSLYFGYDSAAASAKGFKRRRPQFRGGRVSNEAITSN
jgi:hypothetical protein